MGFEVRCLEFQASQNLSAKGSPGKIRLFLYGVRPANQQSSSSRAEHGRGNCIFVGETYCMVRPKGAYIPDMNSRYSPAFTDSGLLQAHFVVRCCFEVGKRCSLHTGIP